MKPAGTMAGVLRRYGQTAVLHPEEGEDRQVRAFLQPILDRERDSVPTPIGRREQGKYLYLAAPEGAPVGVEYIEMAGRRYKVRTARPIRVGDAISHWWAVLEAGEESA